MKMTPELSPQIEGNISIKMTPLLKRCTEIGLSILTSKESDDLQSFTLEDCEEDKNNSLKHKKIKKQKFERRPRLGSAWLPVTDDLALIVQQNYASDLSEEQQYSISEDQDYISEKFLENSKINQIEEQKQSTTNFDLLGNDSIPIEWNLPNTKKKIISKLKEIEMSQTQNDVEKIQKFKEVLEKYIFEYQRFYFQDAISSLTGSVSNIMATLIKGIEQTFKKNIGGLSFQKRRVKLLKYMEKKKRRIWGKKINYDCRKKVADGRLRSKGKFVTYEQTCELLNLSSLEGYTAEEVKAMLEKCS